MTTTTLWVLRLDSGGWWSGRSHEPTLCPLDAASFASPADARAAMVAAGWRPGTPGFIEPLRLAVSRAPAAQLVLAF